MNRIIGKIDVWPPSLLSDVFTAAFTAFVVIHNGIITNYKELREYLVSQNEAVDCDVR